MDGTLNSRALKGEASDFQFFLREQTPLQRIPMYEVDYININIKVSDPCKCVVIAHYRTCQ